MSFILWLVFGALVGWIASMIVGNNGEQGWVGNIVSGILGSMLGGWIASMFYHPINADGTYSSWNIVSIIFSVIGAVIVIAIWRAIQGQRPIARDMSSFGRR